MSDRPTIQEEEEEQTEKAPSPVPSEQPVDAESSEYNSSGASERQTDHGSRRPDGPRPDTQHSASTSSGPNRSDRPSGADDDRLSDRPPPPLSDSLSFSDSDRPSGTAPQRQTAAALPSVRTDGFKYDACDRKDFEFTDDEPPVRNPEMKRKEVQDDLGQMRRHVLKSRTCLLI